jgi:UDP-GlcNAc3NAcA epimerase
MDDNIYHRVVETVKDGWNVLAGCDKERIIEVVNEFEPEGKQRDVFGCGSASERIIGLLLMVSKAFND